MHFSSITITTALAFLATGVTADWFWVDNSAGIWINNYKEVFHFNAEPGCRNPGITGIYRICIDYPNKRAHFEVGNAAKRCLVETMRRDRVHRFEEVGCSW
ncbi:hypothetical protein HJFPF1_11256 [Paramyrothecium foliicola]|nr:hypothetical protein HJFPF1_11256 [Paramyrothecium foliicola]